MYMEKPLWINSILQNHLACLPPWPSLLHLWPPEAWSSDANAFEFISLHLLLGLPVIHGVQKLLMLFLLLLLWNERCQTCSGMIAACASGGLASFSMGAWAILSSGKLLAAMAAAASAVAALSFSSFTLATSASLSACASCSSNFCSSLYRSCLHGTMSKRSCEWKSQMSRTTCRCILCNENLVTWVIMIFFHLVLTGKARHWILSTWKPAGFQVLLKIT